MRLRPSLLPRRARTIAGLLAGALVASTAAVAPAGAETASSEATAATATPARLLAPPSPALPGLPDMALALSGVPVSSPEFDRAAARYARVDATHADARAVRHDLDHTTTVLQGRVRQLEGVRASARARIAGLTARLEVIDAAIQELAVESFVVGGDEERLNRALVSENPAINEVERRDVLGGLTMDVLLAERAAYRTRIAQARQRVDTATEDQAEAGTALSALHEQRPDAARNEIDAADAVATERVAYEGARVLATVEGVEFPLVALDAYYRAAEAVSEERPTCRVRWWGLAGISRVEGRHGTYGGTALEPNGDTTRRIIGLQLNGRNETARIGDSDGGALDGDPAFDRAVGPMQFIPQTWSRYQADGNDDGTRSPFNLYDATLAAARYLCSSSSRLDDDPGLRTAYFSYNRSVRYVDSVLGYARLYQRTVDVADHGG